jgi:hypothetical protein
MKPALFILMATLLLCANTCNKSKFKNPMTVTDVYNYSDQKNTPCTGTLKHEGEEVVLKGYIQKLNTFPSDNRFHIFENTGIAGQRLEVHVINNSKEIFNVIFQKLSKLNDEDFVSITVCGTISGQALPMNGTCKMGTFINLSNPDYIYLK